MRVQLRLSCVGFVLALLAAPAQAQYPTQTVIERLDGITVYGTGEVRAKPNLIEIDFQNSGTAELSGDAIVKYRDNKRRMIQAFEGLKLKNLNIEERGVSLTGGGTAAEMEQAVRGGASPATKSQLQVSRTLRLSLSGVQDMSEQAMMETLGRMFDVGKDFGLALAPSPEAQTIASRYGRTMSGVSPVFVLSDISDLREQAYRKAIEDARARAARLAMLTGVKLGTVLGVSETQVSGDDPAAAAQPCYYYYYGYQQPGTGDGPGPRVTSASFAEIPIRVKLQVRFGIAKSETEATEK